MLQEQEILPVQNVLVVITQVAKVNVAVAHVLQANMLQEQELALVQNVQQVIMHLQQVQLAVQHVL